MKQWHNLFLVTAFGLGLAMPTIGSLGHVSKHTTIKENRALVPLPRMEWHLELWRSCFSQIEASYGDHFGFRESLIAFDLAGKRRWFPEELGPEVLRGRDGWMYLKRDGRIDLLDDCLGMTGFSEAQLEDAKMKLEQRRDWLAAQGIKYVFLIAPDKQSIYPEHLPAWLPPAKTNRTDQFVAYMHLHSTVDVLDLRPALREASRKTDVYYVTDPHWNVSGSYVASEAIVANLAGQIPRLAPLSLGEFAIQRRPETGGDLARLAAEPDLVESNNLAFIPGPSLPALEFSAAETNQVDLPLMWSLPVPEIRTITTKNPGRAGMVIMFGDSFAVDLQPFLGYHFGRAICLRRKYEPLYVKLAHPDVVIDEQAERYLFYR